VAPVEPVQPTEIGPDGGADGAASGHFPPKITAGPYCPLAPFGSANVAFPPVAGSVTEGLLAVSGAQFAGVFGAVQVVWPNPRIVGGPPNRPTFVW
jgi:hypothetical protein